MAIGLSLTPRSYNVDPTGRDYVLDPEPLLNVAERSFMAQKENLRNMAAVAQQGVALGEYIGARQQLGRVKAGLSELDVSDPLFAQKYSSLVADNPLAFTNERLAPVTKAAITPVLASAAQAMEDRAALERARVMAGYQAGMARTRAGLQQQYYDYQREHPRPAQPRQPGLGERLLFGDPLLSSPQQTPAQAAPVQDQAPPPAPGVDNYGPELPTNSYDAYGGGLIPFSPYDDEGPRPETGGEVIEGEGDGPATLPPNIRNTQLGPMRIKSVGEGVTLEPVVEAVPTQEVPSGYMDVPDSIIPETGTAASRKLVPIPEAILKQRTEVYDALIDTDPGIAALNQNAALLGETYKAAKDALASMPEDKKGAAAEALVPQAAAAAIATSAAAAAKAQAKMQMLAGDFPQAAAVYNQRQAELQAQAIPQQGTGEAWAGNEEALLRTPAPRPPAAEPSVRDQLAQMEYSGQSAAPVWDQEKRFVLQEAKSLALRLGLRENAIIEAAKNDDRKTLELVRRTMSERGVRSPLYSNSPFYEWQDKVVEFAKSPKLRRSYGEILGIAAKDPIYTTPAPVKTSSGKVSRVGQPFTQK